MVLFFELDFASSAMEDSENISYGFSPKSSFSKNQITSDQISRDGTHTKFCRYSPLVDQGRKVFATWHIFPWPDAVVPL